MINLSKKLTLTLLAVLAAVCLTFGLLYTLPKTASADTGADQPAQLSELGDFSYTTVGSGYVLTGLSTAGTDKISEGNGYFTIELPANVTAVGSESSTSSFLGAAYIGKLTSITFNAELEKINDYAFYGCTGLGSIDLSGATSLKTIGVSAFNSNSNSKVESITIPSGVTSIGNLAFANHRSLKTINFNAAACADFSSTETLNPFYRAGYSSDSLSVVIGGSSAVTKIPAYMFYNKPANPIKVTSVNFANVDLSGEGSSFGVYAFAYCASLTSVTFESISKVTSLGDYAFYQCTALTQIQIPAETKVIGKYAFASCTALNNILYVSPSSLTTFDENAFYQCKNLQDIKIPATVTTINKNAFSNSGLTQVTIPSGVGAIGSNAFGNCSALATINFNAKKATSGASSPFLNSGTDIKVYIGNADNRIEYINPYLFYGTKISYVKLSNVNITKTGDFGQAAFASCSLLAEVEFENCVITSIGGNVFSGCSALRSVNLPDSLTSISEAAFYNCGSLYEVNIPRNVTSIGANAFFGCVSIYTITIPQNVTSIGSLAFYGCTKLLEVINLSNLGITAGSETATGNDAGTAITDYTGKYARKVYTSAGVSNISEDNGYVFYKDNDSSEVLLIGYVGTETDLDLSEISGNFEVYIGAFKNNQVITGITISDNVTVIHDEAFSGCTSLKEVIFSGAKAGEILQLGSSTFYNCSALTSVNLPEGIVSITNSMFTGCSALTSINIPSTVTKIEANAFKDCKKLRTVTFNEYTLGGNLLDSENGYKLEIIDQSAFENCTALTTIILPNTVKSIGGYAFKGCTNLSVVYMPDKLENYSVVELFENCSYDLIIIAPAETYNSYLSSFGEYGKVTYIIKVYMIDDEHADPDNDTTTSQYVERLYGFTYDFVKQSNGSWAKTGGMPVQDGYSVSVWYSDVNLDSEVDGDKLTLMLSPADYSAVIKLYAKYISKPELVKKLETATYGGKNINASDIFQYANGDAYANNTEYRINITGYRLVGGAAADIPDGIMNAGTYTLMVAITDSDKYGVWESVDSIVFTFIVSPAQRNIEGQISWITVDSTGNKASELAPASGTTVLYLYGGADDSSQTPYLNTQEDRTDLQGEIPVTNSYVMYGQGAERIVALDMSNVTYFNVTAYAGGVGTVNATYNDEIIGVKASLAGVYLLEVELTADNNYVLACVTEQSSGMKFEPVLTSSGYKYTLQKTWYIAMEDGNSLLNADGTPFSLPTLPNSDNFGWTYGDAGVKAALAAPMLSNTPVKVDGENLITFTISSLDIWGENELKTFEYDMYTDVINYTMPVGYYDLSITVKGTGSYSEETRTFSFEVVKADYSGKLSVWGITGKIYGDLYKDTSSNETFTLEYNGRLQFADTSSVGVLALDTSVIYVREGIWATNSEFYNNLYKGFTIEYNLDGLSNYYSESNIVNGPSARGKYTVYFNITSSNYVSLVDTTSEFERKKYNYTLYIKETIDVDAIDIGTVTYTGSEIRLIDTDYFKFVYLNGTDQDSIRAHAACGIDEEYISAGTHYIAVMIRSGYVDSYGWKQGNTIKPYTEYVNGVAYTYYFALRQFIIAQAQNETTKPLSIREWTYGSEPNAPVWSTKYVRADDADFYSLVTFRLQSVTDLTEVYYYVATESGQKTFADAPAGEYKLIATAVGGGNYNWASLTETYEYTVTIYKATISLVTDPYIASWKYGDYEEGNIKIEFELEEAFSGLSTVYYITTRDEYEKLHSGEITEGEMKNRYVDAQYMLDDIGQIPAGNYVLVLKLDDDVELNENFERWSYAVYFSVVKTSNYWLTTPSVYDWVYGDYSTRDTTINYQPMYGDKNSVIFTYYRVDENNIRVDEGCRTIAELAEKYGKGEQLSVGKYELCAVLRGTNDYDDLVLENMYFKVTKGKNRWAQDGVPSVTSWSQGNWDPVVNKLTAATVFNDYVEFSVYSANDVNRENPYDINDLNALGVGSYILVAHVTGGSNYEDLTSETTFAVFEDSVGMTGLIATTMVFAVIAVGLAVGGIVLLIRRNKKIEEEFRRMIRSELRRK